MEQTRKATAKAHRIERGERKRERERECEGEPEAEAERSTNQTRRVVEMETRAQARKLSVNCSNLISEVQVSAEANLTTQNTCCF